MAVLLPWPEASSDPKHIQPVMRSVADGIFIHFYLACGHLITISKSDVGERSPSTIECWACAENGNPNPSH